VALLHRAIDSLSNLAATIGIRSSEFPKYGGILVGNRQPIYMSTPVLEAMHDSLMVSFAPGNVWSIPDTGGSFAALLLSMLRREKPVSIIGYDTIEATWFLKMVDQATVALPPRSAGSAALNRTGGPVRFFPQQRAVEVRLERPQHVSVAVFDCLGKRQYVLFVGVLAAGQRRFSLSSSARGVSLIRVQVGGAESVFIDLPMH
jgi:hypothetical protein